MGAWASQVVVVAAVLAACEAPARDKPWRHAADPLDQGQVAPASKMLLELQAAAAGADAGATRTHTLRIHVDADPGRLAPTIATSLWARRITVGTVFEPLLKYVSNGPPSQSCAASPKDCATAASLGGGTYAPGLASRWQVAPSGLEVRIELQPNVTFHDGRPLSAVDVQFSLDAMREPRAGNAYLRHMLDDVVAVELINSREVRLRLQRPSGWVLRALAEIPILPMHLYDGGPSTGEVMVGTGPWQWVSNKNGVVHLTRNANYWGAAPSIADLEFVYQPDAAIALTAAKRGDLDIVPALIAAHWPEQASAPSVVAAFRPLQLMPARLRYFAFNGARAPMDDPRVRQAMALLLDRRVIAKRVFGGLARPVLWPVWPGGPASGVESAVPDFDPASAGKLLDASGWVDSDKDGIRDKSGTQLRLVLIGTDRGASPHLRASSKGVLRTPADVGAPSSVSSPVAADEQRMPADAGGTSAAPKSERELFVETARRAGVIVDVRTGTESAVVEWITDGAYDVVELVWAGMGDGDIAEMIAGGGRAAQAQLPIARILDELRTAWSPDERWKRGPDVVAALAETWPISGIVAEAPQGLVHKRVANVRVWNGWIDLSALSLTSNAAADAASPSTNSSGQSGGGGQAAPKRTTGATAPTTRVR